jgi:uncharacterized membrane protein
MSETIQPSHGGASSTGLDPNVAAGLSYVLGAITGIIFFLVEKDNAYVRFHAAQSIVVFGAVFVANILLSVIGAVLGNIPGLGIVTGLIVFAASMLLALGALGAWLYLMIKAFTGSGAELPVAAPYARKLLGARVG